MLVRYRVVVLVLLFTVMPQRASFPCDVASHKYSHTAVEPWRDDSAQFGPLFYVFLPPGEGFVFNLYRDGIHVPIELVPVEVEAFARVSNVTVYTPNPALEPGRYCSGHIEGTVFVENECVVLESGLTADDSAVTASMRLDEITVGSCGNAIGCSGGGVFKERWSEITLTGVDTTTSARVANWLVELRAINRPWEEGRAELLRDYVYDGVETIYAADLPAGDPICVRVSAVLWDGTVLPPHDAGCDAF